MDPPELPDWIPDIDEQHQHLLQASLTIDPETRICTVGLEGPAGWILRFIQSNAEEGLIKHLEDEAALKASGILNIVTPESAVQMITDYIAAVPIQRFYSWTIPPGYPVSKMNEHLELFANKVMPHFR